jgi:hypothetical protein
MEFLTHKINDEAAIENGTWQDVQKEAAKNLRSKIVVSDANAINISDEQRGWIHCENGPVRFIMKTHKITFLDAKVFCKVHFGRSFFVKLITADNCNKIEGIPYFECLSCREIIHVAKLNYEQGGKCCSSCGSKELQLIAIASSEKQSVKTISLWMKELIDKLHLAEPDAEWWNDQKEKLRKAIKETSNVE